MELYVREKAFVLKVILSIDAFSYPITGIGRYVLELVRHLRDAPQIESLALLRGTRLLSNLPDTGSEPGVAGRMAKKLVRQAATYRAVRDGFSLAQSQKLRSHRDALLHGPNFYLPAFRGRSVVTIHDLSVFRYPETHPVGRVRRLSSEIQKSIRRADAVITDSEFTRREVIDYFGVDATRIHSAPLAASPEFHPRDGAELQPHLDRYGLRAGHYCLFAGTIEPRKNVDVLLDAYGALPKTLRKSFPLVVVGHRGWLSEGIHARLKDGAARGEVNYLGYVDATMLPELFAGARLFVYPSRYEGFGLPVLEAMASGTPVLCSNAASLSEIAGDAAATCGPDDIDQFTVHMQKGLENDEWHSRMRERGLVWAKQFNWARTAAKTIEAYKTTG